VTTCAPRDGGAPRPERRCSATPPDSSSSTSPDSSPSARTDRGRGVEGGRREGSVGDIARATASVSDPRYVPYGARNRSSCPVSAVSVSPFVGSGSVSLVAVPGRRQFDDDGVGLVVVGVGSSRPDGIDRGSAPSERRRDGRHRKRAGRTRRSTTYKSPATERGRVEPEDEALGFRVSTAQIERLGERIAWIDLSFVE